MNFIKQNKNNFKYFAASLAALVVSYLAIQQLIAPLLHLTNQFGEEAFPKLLLITVAFWTWQILRDGLKKTT